MKILNIDAFVAPKRKITIDGVAHSVLSLSVDQFITNLAAQEAIETAQGGESFTERTIKATEDAIASLIQVVPTLPRERIGALPLEALGAMLSFVRGEMDGEGAAPAGAVTDEVEGPDAKKAT